MQKTIQLNQLLEGKLISSTSFIRACERVVESTCEHCAGTGVLHKEPEKLTEFVKEVNTLSTLYIDSVTMEILKASGLAPKNASTTFSRKGKTYKYSAANPLFKTLLKDTKAVRKQILGRRKLGRKVSVEEITTFVNNINSTYYNVFEPCPYCSGTGTYPLNLINLAKTVVSVAQELYVEKAQGRQPAALKKSISVNSIINLVKIKGIQFDKRPKTIRQVLSAKNKYKSDVINGLKKIELVYGGLSYGDVALYFNKLAQTARVDTGNLKAWLQRQYTDAATKDPESLYPFNTIIIKGPKASETNPKYSNNNFIYGIRFIENSPIRNALPWNNKGIVTSIIERETIKEPNVFFKYFSMRS